MVSLTVGSQSSAVTSRRKGRRGGANYWDLPIFVVLGSYAVWALWTLAIGGLIGQIDILMLMGICALNIFGAIVAVRTNSLAYTAIFYFNVIFFSFAPMEQISLGFDPIYGNREVLEVALAVVLLWSALCVAFLILRIKQVKVDVLPASGRETAFNPTALWLCSLAATFLGIWAYGSSLFSSREAASQAMSQRFDLSIGLMLTGCIFPFSFYSALVGLRSASRRGSAQWRFLFSIALLGSLALNNFTILSRYQFGILVFFSIFFWLGIRPWSSRLLLLSLLAGTIASPLFHIFRSRSATLGSFEAETFFSAMDYDAFSMLCHTIFHVDHSGISYGANILSALLFFVPRSLWIDKLQATPFYLMDSLSVYRGLWSFNLSEPLVAEGYFAFGMVGVLALSFAFLALVNRLDRTVGGVLSPFSLFRFSFPIIGLMVLRGSLIVGVSIVVGHFLALVLITRLLRQRLTAPSA